jgi:hypothetical protein
MFAGGKNCDMNCWFSLSVSSGLVSENESSKWLFFCSSSLLLQMHYLIRHQKNLTSVRGWLPMEDFVSDEKLVN